ncbi:LAME_0F16358g1_1 [Lachancea meyersii CBS 8951]|uniref:LAME_0F16358g1_1 n=1 Tax=Lachancea meyersii CBS 8951 TaxID=1266667 RepID=A0A1G4JZ25_9SACH|nr:LAME_0F16358g1_1 [Lachancea meyersii CBS 8951]
MDNKTTREYIFIKSPDELLGFFSEDEVVNSDIEFVSVLTDIDFDTNSRCHLYFKNFQNGDTAEPDYTCRITCNTPATLNLTQMTLSLFSQHFDLELPDLEQENHFRMEDVHLDKLCFVKCKGSFVSRGNKGGIFLQGLRPVDLAATLFAAKEKDMGSAVYDSTQAIFDNLIKLNCNSKAQFKFVKLSNLTNDMRQYFQTRQESMQLMKARNPIYGVARAHYDHDSLNDFDSQVSDTDPDFNSVSFFHKSRTDNDREYQCDSFINDSVGNSEISQRDASEVIDIATADKERLPASNKSIQPSIRTYPRMIPKVEVSSPKLNAASSHNPNTASYTRDHLHRPYRSDVVTNSQVVENNMHSSNGTTHNPTKKRRFSAITNNDINSMISLVSNAATDEILTLEMKIVGMRIERNSTGPSVAIFCQADSQELESESKILYADVNCLEIKAHSSDNIRCGSDIIDAESSEKLMEILWNYCKEEIAEIKVKKVPLLLGNGHFTFTLTLRSVYLKDWDNDIVSPPLTPGPSQVVVSSCESSQELRDPLKTFSSISVKENQVEFLKTFGLLVSAKRFGPKVTKFAFTDFTSHPRNTLSAFDAFLGTYDNRLAQSQAFPFVIYSDHLAEFARRIREKMGLAYQDLFDGYDNNLTHRGIVCRLELKVKLYNGGVDGIIRTCDPVFADDASLRPDERAFLSAFYARSITQIPQSLLVNKFDSYRLFFPITMFNGLVVIRRQNGQDAGTTVPRLEMSSWSNPIAQWEPPNLSAVAEGLKIISGMELPVLASVGHLESAAVFEMKAKIVDAFQAPEWLIFYLTNDYITQDMLDPHRLLRVEIPGARNVARFYGGGTSRLTGQDIMRITCGQELTFRLSPFKVPVSSSKQLRVWCPIECTIYEMKAELSARQAALNVHVKQEDQISG